MRTHLLATAAGAALLLGAGALHAKAGDSPEAAHATLTLSAYGETQVKPDMATVSLSAVSEASTAAEAMAQNRARAGAMLAALRRAGVAETDLHTTGVDLQPQYDYPPNQPAHLRGYEASNQISVTVNDLGRLGAVVDAAVAAGADRVNSLTLDVRDRQKAEDAARVEAVKALQAKAKLYAEATGLHLSGLKSLTEDGTPNWVRPQVMATFARVAAPSPTPVEPGELTLRVDVQGVWNLD